MLERIFNRRQDAITTDSPLYGLVQPSASGVVVTPERALSVTTVFDCLRVMSDGVSQVPLQIYKSEGSNREPAIDHPLYNVLRLNPNEWQTSFEFRENLMFQAGLLGNFFAFKNKVRGQIRSLIPFEPNTVSVVVDSTTRKIAYNATMNGESKIFPAESIWHVRGPSWNTYIGMKAVEYAREAIGLSINIEDSQSKLHANGVQISGIYSFKGNLSQKQNNDLLAFIKRNKSGDPMIVDREATFTPVTMSGTDAQTIENRRFQIEEICRAFRVMPIMIGQSDKAATYASAEQQFLAHVVHTLMPWYTRLEQSIDCNLLTEADRAAGYYSNFKENALMRGTSEVRSSFYDKMYRMKAMSPNEIRELEDMNPYDGGDVRYVEPGSQKLDSAASDE